MTVGALIERLMEFDANMTVVVNMGKNELANGCEAGSVEKSHARRWGGNDFWTTDYYPEIEGDLMDGESRTAVVNITNS